MKARKYDHLREIRLEKGRDPIAFVLETASPEVPQAADQLAKDIAATLSMYTRRLDPLPGEVRIRLGGPFSTEGTSSGERFSAEGAILADGSSPAGTASPDEAPEAADNGLMEKVRPRFTLDDFVCDPAFRRILDDVVFYARHFPEIRRRMGVPAVTNSFLVNFFGPSGTGKTMVAEAVAAALGKELYVMNFANVESSLLGRTPKNIARAFRAIDPENALVLLDEADAFVSRRITDLRQGAEYALNTARGRIIAEIDRFPGTILLATNLFATYDNAILRRIKFNLQFELPGPEAAAQMYERFLDGTGVLPGPDRAQLAAGSEGLSGGDIFNISEILVMKSLQAEEAGREAPGLEAAQEVLRYYRLKSPSGRIRPTDPDNKEQNRPA